MRRGELTTTQLVTIFILIVSFLVILFFIYRLNPKDEVGKDLCYNSVILRSNSPIKNQVLECHTNYICISDSEKCTNAPSAAIINNKDDVKTVGDEITNCWNQFGEGNNDFLDIKVFKTKSCGICSQFFLNNAKIDSDKINEYMSNKNLAALKNSLVIPSDFKFDKDFSILYEVNKRSIPGLSVFDYNVKIIYSDQIKNENCDEFFTLA